MERGALSARVETMTNAGPGKGNPVSVDVPKEVIRAAIRAALNAVASLKQFIAMLARRVGVLIEPLLRLPGVVARAMRVLVSNKPVRMVLAAAASLVCISLQCSRSTGASVQLSSSLSLLFGIIRVQGSMVIELGPPKPISGPSGSQREDIRISCSKDLKDHIVRFLESQAARNTAEAAAATAAAAAAGATTAGPCWQQLRPQEERVEEEESSTDAAEAPASTGEAVAGMDVAAAAAAAAAADGDDAAGAAPEASLRPSQATEASAGVYAGADAAAVANDDIDGVAVEEYLTAEGQDEAVYGCDSGALYGTPAALAWKEREADRHPLSTSCSAEVAEVTTWAVLASSPVLASTAAPRLPSTPSLSSSPTAKEPYLGGLFSREGDVDEEGYGAEGQQEAECCAAQLVVPCSV